MLWLVMALMSPGVAFAHCEKPDSAAAVERLCARLRALLRPLEQRAQVGVVIADTRGRRYFEHNAGAPLTPASITKLFWTAAALATFGDSAFLCTRILADAPLEADGVVRGNLYVVGAGDALLSLQDLEELAAQLARCGVRRVTGSVFGDGSLFDNQRSRVQYSGDADVVEPLPSITALGFNRNEVRVVVNAVRGRVTAQAVPASPAFVVNVSGVRAVSAYRKRRPQRGARLSASSVVRDGIQYISIRGRVPAEGTWSLVVPMEQPEVATAATFLQRLRAAGIQVDGGFGTKECKQPQTVLAEWLRPLPQLLAVINKESDNFVAEHLFKLLGSRAVGYGVQTERARSLLQTFLQRWGVSCRECRFRDGSGLSRQNRASAADVVELLRAMLHTPFSGVFRQSLAMAGVDGTLKRRLRDTGTIGRIWAKTGTLRNASALAGYVYTADGEPLAFALLSFGNVARAKPVEDSVVAVVSRFSFCEALSHRE
ncbi:MAG: D-alanyl-D-alanine carboxypeptidase/D-alanyl-D-alanine-endopeptidase [Bacteroidota bacterium]|nr:D-alanyl-D-alanine carboxypeptidase/D-alanyl-D-alanine-endopeptidase [Bacteroidota bacterium]